MGLFFQQELDLLLFVYSLLMFAIAALTMPLSRLAFRRGAPWLGLYALAHGLRLWFDILALEAGVNLLFQLSRLLVMTAGYLFLFEFGRVSWRHERGAVLPWWSAVVLFLPVLISLFLASPDGANTVARCLIGCPAGLLAAWVLARGERGGEKTGTALRIAAGALFCYALSLAAVIPDGGFLPSTAFSNQAFSHLFGFPVQFLRMVFLTCFACCLWQTITLLQKRSGLSYGLTAVVRPRYLVPVGAAVCALVMLLLTLADQFGRKFDNLRFGIDINQSVSDLTHAAETARRTAALLAASPKTRHLAQAPYSDELVKQYDAELDEVSGTIAGSIVYFLDKEGMGVASSNHGTSFSFEGKSYANRPYFRQASKGSKGFCFAMGLTAKEPGGYFSHPVLGANGSFLGAVVIKLGLRQLTPFLDNPNPTFLVSPEGVVLVSSVPGLALRALWPVDEGRLRELVADAIFPAIDAQPIINVRVTDGMRAETQTGWASVSQRVTSLDGWSIVQLRRDTVAPWFRLAAMVNIVLILALVLTFAAVYFKERERRGAVTLSEQHYRAMFEKSLLSKLIVDPTKGRIVAINEAARRFFEIPADGQPDFTLNQLLGSTAEEGAKMFADIMQSGGRLLESQQFLSNRQSRHVEVVVTPLEQRGTTMLFVIVIDVSARKRIEQEKQTISAQLAHAAKLASIGALAAGVAHEINNPLTIIRGYGEILASWISEIDPSGKALAISGKLIAATERIASIVGSLRTYARADTAHIEEVDLNKVVRDTLAFVQQIAGNAGVEITQKLTSVEPYVSANIGKLQQVLINLVTNACDALEGRSGDRRIVVETVVDGGEVWLLVSDNGCGIKPADLARIFDPFFTTKPSGKGTGLGLAISRSIIASFGGSLQVSSKEAEGCTFRIGLSVVPSGRELADDPSRGASREPRAAEVLFPAGCELLVVDDEPDVCALLSDYFTQAGMTVRTLSAAGPALELLRTQRFDVVIIDLQLPDFSGLSLLRKARGLPLAAQTKYIIITGGVVTAYSDEERADLRKYAHGYLLKPFDRRQVTRMVHTLWAGDEHAAASESDSSG